MKGILLAGGLGTRLDPLTRVASKQLLPVYNRPMIHYPLATLMRAGIRSVLVISAIEAIDGYKRLLGDGSRWGMRIAYAVQLAPAGIAEALIIGRSFVGQDNVALILGDNIFDGPLPLGSALHLTTAACIYTYPVANPHCYGVVELNERGEPVTIDEKPLWPRSNLAITGVYVYSPLACEIAAKLSPSARGELEISDVNREFMRRKVLRVRPLEGAWFDCGTFDDLLQAGNYVQAIEKRTSCPMVDLDAIAEQNGWIKKPTSPP